MTFIKRRIDVDATHDVASTLMRRSIKVACPLGPFKGSPPMRRTVNISMSKLATREVSP